MAAQPHRYARLLVLVSLALSVAGALVYAVWLLGPRTSYDNLMDWVYHEVIVMATAACFIRAALGRSAPGAWVAIGLGLLAWTAGDVYWTIAFENLRVTPYPSWADLGYLAVFPFFYVGISLLIRERVGHLTMARWLDGAIAALGAGALATAILAPALVGLTEGDPAAVLTNMAYPLGDVILIALVVGAIVVGGLRGAGSFLLIGAGLLAWSLGDVIYLVQEATSSYEIGWIDETWLVGSVLMGGAAAFGFSRAVRRPGVYQSNVLVPVVFTAVAVGVMTWDHYERVHPVSIWLAVATLLAVVLRLGISFRENLRLVRALHDDSTTDALTGLGNRRKLFDDLDWLLSHVSAREAGTRVFALFDLDGFKSYNDTFGHPAGDALLRRLGAKLQAAMPTPGAAYRLGGDEFCILVECRTARPAAIAAAARHALTETGEGFSIGASGGVVLVPEEAHTTSDVLRTADQRMYAQKGASPGRIAQQTRDLLRSLVREREPSLGEHQNEVAERAVTLGRELSLEAEELDVLWRAAEFHDVGKIAIPDEILHKPGPLNEIEWELMRKHPLIGARLIGHSTAMAPVAKLVRSSHERWDGGGYPDGTAGSDIPLGSRIIFVCDAFEAMTDERPYQPAISRSDALEELQRNAGTQFDPKIVEMFIRQIEMEAAALDQVPDVPSPAGTGSGPGPDAEAPASAHARDRQSAS